MPPTERSPTGSRETRLLVATIVISVGVLLLLARFRFPQGSGEASVEPSPAPLERLAARAAYDELASVMADLERRIAPRVAVVQVRSEDGRVSPRVAPRLMPDRAVATVLSAEAGEDLLSGTEYEAIGTDVSSGLAVVRVPAVDDSTVTQRQGLPRPGPRYLAVAEASALGLSVRPLYVGRIGTMPDPRSGVTLITLAGHQRDIARGSAIFSLDGTFLGLVRETGEQVSVMPGEHVRSVAEAARPAKSTPGDLGVDVDALTDALTRTTGAGEGAIVVRVRPGGPADGALRSGDVIQAVDGTSVAGPFAFRELERGRAPGSEVTVAAVRSRSLIEVRITAREPAAATTPADGPGIVGRTVAGIGVEVVAIRQGSAADRAGLVRGDLIVAIDGIERPDMSALARRFRGQQPSPALVTIQRGDRHRVVAVEPR